MRQIKSKIKILDCTLRDGGYYNNWNFSKNLVQQYLDTMSETGIEYVELGFRFLKKNSKLGSCAFTKDSFIKSFKIPKNINIGIMVNASDLNSLQISNEDKVKLILGKKSKRNLIRFIRFACHLEDVKLVLPLIKIIKKEKIKVFINLMQISDIKKRDLMKTLSLLSKSKMDIFYFADSMGSLDSNRIKEILKLIKSKWSGEIGFHAHDNMGKALSNVKSAAKNGVTWIDCTVLGMGRGPGNAKTEYVVMDFKDYFNKKVNIVPLLDLIKLWFEPLKKKYDWGPNPYYFLSGLYDIHPTFVQTMISEFKLKPIEILSALENLKKIGGKKFNKSLIESENIIYKDKTTGSWNPKKQLKNKTVLILGAGPSLFKFKDKIEKYIKKNKPFVMVGNNLNIVNEKFINVRIACHTLRVLTEYQNYKKNSKPLVLPIKRLKNIVLKSLNKIKKLDFGIQIEDKKFVFNKNWAVLPYATVIDYSLAIATSGCASKILLAGFDGFNSDVDPRNLRMNETFKIYNSMKESLPLYTITPTKYKIKLKSKII